MEDRKKIFAGMDVPSPDFKIVANHVRVGKTPRNYLLDDPEKLKSVVEKWQFRPKPAGNLNRCGYDYQIIFTNGDASITVSICFLCNTLIVNHSETYKVSKSEIEALLSEDFELI